VRVLFFIPLTLAAMAQPRVLDSVLPSLDYGPACTSSIAAVNLSGREVAVEIQGHKGSGALVLLSGQTETKVRIPPHGRVALRLQVDDETGAGWVRIREPAAPALALSGSVECVDGDKLVTAPREVVYPMRQPWFAGEIADLQGGVITAINVSDRPASLSACYSAGNLVSNGRPELVPLCSASLDLQIPPFGTRRVAVERGGNSWFSLKTTGEALVLEMLRPLAPRVKLYKVDSTIQFGQEVTTVK
jgi:xanthosine utilization system XapX-like protein